MTATVSRLVDVALVFRLVTLAVALVGLVDDELTVQVLVATLLLGGSSIVVLTSDRVRATVLRHPLLAMADVLLAVFVLVGPGIGSPLVLATFPSALLVGVLFRPDVAALLGFCLAVGYVGVAVDEPALGNGRFLVVYGVPALYASLVAIGQAVRRVASQQVEAERVGAAARERARLARDMHDSFAKTLQGIALGATALPTWIERDPAVAVEQARALAAAADAAVQQARDLLVELRRDAPGRPFPEVVALTCDDWTARTGIPCDANVTLARDPEPAVRHQLLGALCEALDNAAAHARPTLVRVSVREQRGHVVVAVDDDGVGFDLDVIDLREREGHFGLRGMDERLREVGGVAVVDAAAGRGTTVTLRAPLERRV